MTQYFFVDESGEPGFHAHKGSPYFIVVMVQMAKWEPIDELTNLRETLHLSPTYEFHYAKTSLLQKLAFYQGVLPVNFRARAAVLLKEDAPRIFHKMSGLDLIVELLTCLTLRARPADIHHDILIIDGATDALRSALRIRLSQECRRIKRESPFKKIVTASSHKEDGLQLADMIAGAIRDAVWAENYMHYRTFAHKIMDLWEVK